jgi:hypothetical protein
MTDKIAYSYTESLVSRQWAAEQDLLNTFAAGTYT